MKKFGSGESNRSIGNSTNGLFDKDDENMSIISTKEDNPAKWYLKDEGLLEKMTEEEIEEFKGLFDMFDVDGGGSISVKEL